MSLAHILDRSFETTAGPLTLRQIIADRPTVFIAYPMDYTPVCTMQLCSYRDNWARLSALPVQWWGVNQADPEKHLRFKAEKDIPFELITDPDGELLKMLNLWGFLKTKRGFALVSGSGELLASTSIFPFFYQRYEEVIKFLEPHLAKLPAALH